jgi:Tol biopolymer transport system component
MAKDDGVSVRGNPSARATIRRVVVLAAAVAVQALAFPNPSFATYGGTNGEIVYATDTGVRTISPDGSGDQPFSYDGHLFDLSFSADGSKAVVVDSTGHGERIVLLDLANDTHSVVLRGSHIPTETASSVALAPHGRRVVFSDGSYPRHLWTVHVDGSHLTKIATGYGDPDWGSNGRIVASHGIFHADGKRFIATMDPDGSDRTVIATFPPTGAAWRSVYELVPSWAPDCSAVVFTAQRLRIHPDIWWVAADGSNLHKLTDTATTSESGPTFSPDGTTIVLSIHQPHTTESDLWLMAPDGTNLTQLTDTPGTYEYPMAWRPT